MAERRAIENKVKEKSGLDVRMLGDESQLMRELMDTPIGVLGAIATEIMHEFRIDDYQANLYVADKTAEYVKQMDSGGVDGREALRTTAYVLMVACNMALSCLASIKESIEISELHKDLDSF